MQPGATRCNHVQSGAAARCNQVQPGATRYNQVQSGTIRYNQVQSGTIRYNQVPSGTIRPSGYQCTRYQCTRYQCTRCTKKTKTKSAVLRVAESVVTLLRRNEPSKDLVSQSLSSKLTCEREMAQKALELLLTAQNMLKI